MNPNPITCDELITFHRRLHSHTFELVAWADFWPAYTDWLWDARPCAHHECVICADRPSNGDWRTRR